MKYDDYILISFLCGNLKKGDKIPSIRESAKRFGVSKNTMQRIYLKMFQYGLIKKKEGLAFFS